MPCVDMHTYKQQIDKHTHINNNKIYTYTYIQQETQQSVWSSFQVKLHKRKLGVAALWHFAIINNREKMPWKTVYQKAAYTLFVQAKHFAREIFNKLHFEIGCHAALAFWLNNPYIQLCWVAVFVQLVKARLFLNAIK